MMEKITPQEMSEREKFTANWYLLDGLACGQSLAQLVQKLPSRFAHITGTQEEWRELAASLITNPRPQTRSYSEKQS